MSTKDEFRQFTEDDLRWIRRFEKVMEDAPSHLFLFVGAGIVVFPERVMQDSRDGAVVDINGVTIVTKIQYDGGDY